MTEVIGQKRRLHLYIKEHRERMGLTQEQVGLRRGVSKGTVSRWETQQHRLNPEKIAAIADALGIEPDQLWRPPGDESLDAMVKDAPDELRKTAIDIVRRLVRQVS